MLIGINNLSLPETTVLFTALFMLVGHSGLVLTWSSDVCSDAYLPPCLSRAHSDDGVEWNMASSIC